LTIVNRTVAIRLPFFLGNQLERIEYLPVVLLFCGLLRYSLLLCNINITLQHKAEDLYIAKSFYE